MSETINDEYKYRYPRRFYWGIPRKLKFVVYARTGVNVYALFAVVMEHTQTDFRVIYHDDMPFDWLLVVDEVYNGFRYVYSIEQLVEEISEIVERENARLLVEPDIRKGQNRACEEES